MDCSGLNLIRFSSLGVVPYKVTLEAMRAYVTSASTGHHALWLVEHPPVYSLGQRQGSQYCNFQQEIPDIEVVQSDRGGLTTYHGPGQLIFYCLFHLPSLRIGVKRFVYLLEQSVIDMLHSFDVQAHRVEGQPGVYVKNRKIASLGVKVTKGWSYHGIACNFAADLTPFAAIDPCGWRGLTMCNVIDYTSRGSKQAVVDAWQRCLCSLFECDIISSSFFLCSGDDVIVGT